MRQARIFAMVVLLALSVACASNAAVTPAPEKTAVDVVLGMPHCPGLTKLPTPLKFDWRDIETAIEKLADYNWGYYTCALSQPELAAFLKQNMSKSPYVWRTVNQVEHDGGQVTLFYDPFSVTFMYVWTLPKPDTQTSYLIIARGNPGMPQTWECS